MKIRLMDFELETVKVIRIIPFRHPPEAIRVGHKTYVKLERAGLDDEGAWRYREIFVHVVSHEG